MPYTQLTTKERYQITYMRMTGMSQAEIARELGRHRGTICRELARNPDRFCGYHYITAQRLASTRRTQASCRYKLDDLMLQSKVRFALIQRWSPEQIAGRLNREHRNDPTLHISHEAIYQWLYRQHQQGHNWHTCMRRPRVKRRSRCVGKRLETRGFLTGRVWIERRPPIVDRRERFGDWEADTVEGKKGTGLLMTQVERKSRYVMLGKLDSKHAAPLRRKSIAMFASLPSCLRRTMTADNGKEFAEFAKIQKALNMKVYFANPHSPWERGSNENTNGLLRDFFPKGSDMSKVTDNDVAFAQALLNNRPRKCLNYQTPREVLNKLPRVALRI